MGWGWGKKLMGMGGDGEIFFEKMGNGTGMGKPSDGYGWGWGKGRMGMGGDGDKNFQILTPL